MGMQERALLSPWPSQLECLLPPAVSAGSCSGLQLLTALAARVSCDVEEQELLLLTLLFTALNCSSLESIRQKFSASLKEVESGMPGKSYILESSLKNVRELSRNG